MERKHTGENAKLRRRTIRYGMPLAVGLSLVSLTLLTRSHTFGGLIDPVPVASTIFVTFADDRCDPPTCR